jgi:hypothetical protein
MTAAPTYAQAGNTLPAALHLCHPPLNTRTSITPRDAPRAETPPQTTVLSNYGTNVVILK